MLPMLQQRSSRMDWLNPICRRLVYKRLAGIVGGALTIQDAEGSQTFGDSSADLDVHVTVRDPRFYRRVVFGGGLGAAESLMDGEWDCNDLTAFVRIFIRNLELSDKIDGGTAWIRGLMAKATHALRRNTTERAKQNIRKHYDLSNEFYSLWLDPTMTYSCGFFPHAKATMQEASIAKLDLICQKLALSPNDHLVEIGTGWGGLAIHAAQRYGCRVTTTTISDAQHRVAKERIEAAGLEDRITLLREDYRKLTGQYDKLVSVEMIEAVGHHYFPEYFRKCSELLKPDGMALIQAIVIVDQRYEEHIRTFDFIQQYIFPGGCLPSISTMTQLASQMGGMRLVQLDDLAPHYAETLRRWLWKFEDHLPEIRELGFDERFVRMWRYYLTYCEAAFEERQVNVVQTLFAKRGCRHDALLARNKSFGVQFAVTDRECLSEASC